MGHEARGTIKKITTMVANSRLKHDNGEGRKMEGDQFVRLLAPGHTLYVLITSFIGDFESQIDTAYSCRFASL